MSNQKTDTSTEEKIKEAAKTVFYKKGFAATRTRDIAEEAGLNLALLNYYFRSKAKLFELIMTETLTVFVKSMRTILNEENTTLEEKIELLSSNYIDFIIKEPELPTFIVTEVRHNPGGILKKLPVKETLIDSSFLKQHQQAVKEGRITEPNPLHFLMNLMGLIAFPFIAKPIIMGARNLQTEQFNDLMIQRKKLIPIWIKAMMES